MRAVVWIFFWFLYFPLLKIVDLLFFWHGKLRERKRFEKRNKYEWLAHSFRETNIEADLCFEFSSEGEYQQVAPLIDDALKDRKKIELVFFSPSVEKAVMKLAAQYPEQVRYLRYPLVRLFPFIQRRSFTHWVTAKKLVMVRYDLFPEFLLWAMKKDHTLKIIWMTFKKERSQGKSPNLWKKLFLKNAELIIWAGVPDKGQGEQLGLQGEIFDFRMEQIKRRVEMKGDKFTLNFSLYPSFKQHLDRFPKKVILGNAWPSDLFLLRDLPQDVLLVVVPHQLSDEILNRFRESLRALRKEIFEIDDKTSVMDDSKTILVNKKGILCEMYADFPHAYVGGGFEGSIHSVLEPLISGEALIACGPFHHRSTEYDIAFSMNRISEVNTPEQFLDWLNNHQKSDVHDRINSNEYARMRELVISC